MKTRSRLATFVGIGLLALSGCSSSTSPLEDFDNAVEDGAPCAELFELRNELDPGSRAVVDANEALREIGCYSSSSTRTDL